MIPHHQLLHKDIYLANSPIDKSGTSSSMFSWLELQIQWGQRDCERIQHLLVECLACLTRCKRNVEILYNGGQRDAQTQLRKILARTAVST